MQRRHIAMSVLSFLLVLSIYGASAKKDKHIPGFHEVRKLPLSMVAGETVEWQVSFVNPKSKEGLVDITLEIVEKETLVGLGEFTIEGILESYDNPPRQHHYATLAFVETQGGVFQYQAGTEERFNIITLTISSVPNLMPSTYTFTLTVTLQYKD